MGRSHEEFAHDAVARICEIAEEIAPLAARVLPDRGINRRLRLAKLRNAGVEIAALAHWALKPRVDMSFNDE
jgi:hypothetical protein